MKNAKIVAIGTRGQTLEFRLDSGLDVSMPISETLAGAKNDQYKGRMLGKPMFQATAIRIAEVFGLADPIIPGTQDELLAWLKEERGNIIGQTVEIGERMDDSGRISLFIRSRFVEI